MILNHNIASMIACRNVSSTDSNMTRSLEKLSSGLRINKASDDAAGLAISEKMRAQIGGLDVAKRNTQDGVSLLQTADGALAQVLKILQRMRTLAVQAANGTNSVSDKANLQAEEQQLVKEVDNIAQTLKFNNLPLVDGTYATTGIVLQIGVFANETLSINLMSSKSADLGTGTANTVVTDLSKIDVTGNASESIVAVDAALDQIIDQRARIGAYQNRLDSTIENLATTSENLTTAESRIRDVDMAMEMANYTKLQVLMQSGVAMVGQANGKANMIVKLISQQ